MIRSATLDDAPAIRAIYAPIVEHTAISFEETVPSVEEMRGRIEQKLPTHPWLVDEDDGIAGYAYGSVYRTREAYRWSVEVSVYVAEHARRRAVARRLYEALFAELADQGFVQAYAGITVPNAQSVALHESLGFRPCGVMPRAGYKRGAWHDVAFFHRALRECEHPDAPPRRRAVD
ncbi:MAG: arsinothricin resistance N-acetyltransferase ArsN1 family B [Polyangiales bacterium]